jgi:hypothetical protein
MYPKRGAGEGRIAVPLAASAAIHPRRVMVNALLCQAQEDIQKTYEELAKPIKAIGISSQSGQERKRTCP